MTDSRLRELRHKLGRSERDLKALLERHQSDVDAAAVEWQGDYDRIQREVDKPRLLRRVPPVFTHSADERGQVLPPTAADIVEASEGSSYTDLSHRAVSDAGEAVDAATQNRITQEARERFAEKRPLLVGEKEDRNRLSRLRELQRKARRSGVDMTHISEAVERVIADLNERLDEAA